MNLEEEVKNLDAQTRNRRSKGGEEMKWVKTDDVCMICGSIIDVYVLTDKRIGIGHKKVVDIGEHACGEYPCFLTLCRRCIEKIRRAEVEE